MDGNARMERKIKREEQRQLELRLRAKPQTPTPERDPQYYTQRLNGYQSVSSLAGVGNHFNDMQVVDVDLMHDSNDIMLNSASPDYNTISQYVTSQAATARTLESHQSKATARLEVLKAERTALLESVSSLRLRQLVPPGTRKQVDSYEGRLAQANAAYVRARSKYERAAKANSAILAGVSALASKLQFVEPDEEFATVTDQNLAEVIQLCKKKIDHIIARTTIPAANPTSPASAAPLTPFPPQFTVRIKQVNALQAEQDPDESQVPTRASMKSASAALVEREVKKTKRKHKKLGSSDKRTPPPTSRNYSPSPTARNPRPDPTSARHK